MERNTVLAIVLSVAVVIAFSVVQGVQANRARPDVRDFTEHAQPGIPVQLPPLAEPFVPADAGQPLAPLAGDAEELAEQRVRIITDLLEVELTNVGGDMVSWSLQRHRDGDGQVEMILPGDNPARAFSIAFGGLNAQPISDLFQINFATPQVHVSTIGETHTLNISEEHGADAVVIEFFRDFAIAAGQQFRLTKRYEFRRGEYMFSLSVSLDGGHLVPGFNFNGSAYTLSFGPQIGPRFARLDGRQEFRQYLTFANGRRRSENLRNNMTIIDTSPAWAAISGRYFAFIAIPASPANFELNFSEASEPGLPAASRMNIIRRAAPNSPRIDDMFRFYLGPRSIDILNIYNTGDNGFGLRNAQLTEVVGMGGLGAVLRPLETVLKWLLRMFYRLIPNYGVAIILVTLVVKIVFFPLTRKGSEATLRMQSVAPKIKEIQEKHKGNPQKINAEMADLYKKEGYNPISGCLPMLLQIPIFFAMFQLFNNHFDLRGAVFIPGWISDLSVAEYVWEFPEGVRIPLLGWTALRLLPFIYVGSQLIYGKVTQMPGQQSNPQMKMLMYIMPIVFFFVLYDMPSGLLIYWIFSNIFTMVQQLAINKYLAPKRAAQLAAQKAAEAAVSPPQKPKKKRK